MKSWGKTFGVEIAKAWRWVVFVWGVLGQMGGLRGVTQAIYKAITIPLKRGLQ